MDPTDQKLQRVLRSKKQAAASYDRLSRWYDLLAASERQYSLAGIEKLGLIEGQRFLEIGCGTGRILPPVMQALGPRGLTAGIDLSCAMLGRAQARLRSESAATIDLTRADAAHLPFVAESFDAVFLSFTLELFDTPEIPLVLYQCRRVLRRGGRIGVVALERSDTPGCAIHLYEWFHRRLPRLVDCRPIYNRQALEAAGFSQVEVELRHMWGLPVAIACGINPQKTE